MSQTVQSGLTDVTGVVQTTAATTALSNIIYLQKAGAGTSTVGTVPANKRWLIISIDFSAVTAGGAAAQAYLELNNKKVIYCYPTSTATAPGIEHASLVFNLEACPILTAAQTINITSSASITANVCVSYIEESV